MPAAIFYPMGGGLGAIAIWKAFEELLQLGWIEGTLPRLYVTQYAGCAPVVKAFDEGSDACTPWGTIERESMIHQLANGSNGWILDFDKATRNVS